MSRILGDVFQILNGNVGLGTTLPRQRFDIENGHVILQGNLGIGTTDPLYALDTRGDINFSGILRQNGTPYISSQWSTNGTNLYYSDGNVGIGTNLPQSPLHVIGDIRSSQTIYASNLQITGLTIEGTVTSNTQQLTVINNGTGPALIVKQTGINYIAEFYHDDNVVLALADGGLIGINTATPRAPLDIIGDTILTGNIGFGTTQALARLYVRHFDTGTDDIFRVDNTNANTTSLIVDHNGNVGIGTSQPKYALDVYGNTKITGSVTAGSFLGTATQVSENLIRGTYLTGNNYNGSVATAWAVDADSANIAGKVVVRDASGNFSAGTITATALSGTAITDSTSTTSSSTAASATAVKSAYDLAGAALPKTGGTVTGAVTILANLTASNLTVIGDSTILNTITSNTEQMVITNDGTGPALKVTQSGAFPVAEFYDNESGLAMTIANNGNIGIGSTAPMNKLDVLGNVYVSGTITGTLSGTATKVSQDLVRGAYLTGTNYNGAGTTTWAVDADSANTANKVVVRDASGNFSAGTITATLSGTATKVSQDLVRGAYLTGTNYNGAETTTWAVDATTTAVANKVAVRDSIGALYANYLGINTSNLSRTVSVGGDIYVTNTAIAQKLLIRGTEPVLYPPAFLTTDSETLSGYSYGNGTYTVTESSSLSSVYKGWKMFNGASNTPEACWATNVNLYTDTGGGYIGSTSTVIDGRTYYGEWAQIQMPVTTILSSYEVAPRIDDPYYTARRSPRTWYLAGSSNGSSWSMVDVQTSNVWVHPNSKIVDVFVNTKSFSYYRLIVNEVGNVSTPNDNGAAFVGELKLYGRTSNDGTMIVYGDTVLNGKTLVNTLTASNIGIGTTMAIYPLHVEGNTYLNGTITTNNNNINAGTGTITAATFIGTATKVGQDLVKGAYLTGTNYNGAGTTTWAVDADSANTANKVVVRDGSGNFSAGTITASLSGTATQVSQDLIKGAYLTGTNYNGSITTTWEVDADSANTANKVVVRDASGNFSAGTITATLSGTATQVSQDLVKGAYLTGTNYNGSVTTTWEVDADSANTANKVVVRDASGNFSAGTITATLSGTATKVSQDLVRGAYLTGTNYNGAGTTTWAVDADSANTAGKVIVRDASGNFSAGTITATLTGTATKVSQDLVKGAYLTGTNYNGAGTTTWAVDADSANTANKVVVRDASGNFSAGTITATLTGTATKVGQDLVRGAYLTGTNYNGAGTTTWAVDATTTATANKVVVRDASAYLFASGVGIGTATARQLLDVQGGHAIISGNVGIGTTNPVVALTVGSGPTDVTSTIMFNSGDTVANTDKLYWTYIKNGSKIGHSAGWNVNHYAGQSNTAAAPSNGNFHFFTGGPEYNERLTILNNGNVGIGSTVPAYRLDVAGNAFINGIVTTNNNNINAGTGTITAATFSGTATKVSQDLVKGTYLTGANYNGSVATTWAVDADSANTSGKVVVRDASGNFSAGTITASLSGTATQVSSTLTRGSYLTGNDFTGASPTTWAVDATTTATANKVVVRDASAGIYVANIGIGTTTALYPVDVVGDINFTGILRQSGTPYISSQWTTNGANLYYSTGNVGIGTNLPQSSLHVIGDIRASQTIYASNLQVTGLTIQDTITSNTQQLTVINNGTGPALIVKQTGVNYIAEFYHDEDVVLALADGGLIGINTATPRAPLDIIGDTILTGNIGFGTTQALARLYVRHFDTGTDDILRVDNTNTNTTSFIVNHNGNVGIGTSQPNTTLDVYGNATITGTITANALSGSAITNSTSTTSSTIAASATAVKSAYDLAAAALPKTGGLVTGDVTILANLTASNLTMIGESTILNTITSNTEQMIITNAGTGPALKVTQSGAYPVAEFYDNESGLAMTIANDGKIGIGSTTPFNKLDVIGDAYVSGTITGTLSGTATKVSQDLVRGVYLTGTNYNGAGTTTWDVDATTTATANKIVVRDASGGIYVANIGIGTTSVRQLLDIEGGNAIVSGRIGIGTTNPRSKLHIYGYPILGGTSTDTGVTRFLSILDSTITNGISKYLTFGKANSTNNQAEISYTHQGDGSPTNFVAIGLYGSVGININGDGNVGIGTYSPEYRFHMIGNSYLNGSITTNNNNINAGSGTITAAIFSGTATQVSQDLTRGTYLTGSDYNGSVATTWAVDADSANTAGKVVVRDASGNFSAGTITATLSGTATQVSQDLVKGAYLTGINYNGAGTTTWAVDADSANTANKVVVRDGSGNFSAGTITATLSGTATKVSQDLVKGAYLTGINYNGAGTTTWAVDATTTATANKIVARDASAYLFANGVGIGTGTARQILDVQGGHAIVSGNVGVGTTNPIIPLHVVGTNSNTLRLQPLGGASGNVSTIQLWGTFGNYPADTGVRYSARITSGFQDSSTGIWGSEYLAFGVGNNGSPNDTPIDPLEKVRITSTGRVGIGTTNPGYKLEVAGDINYTGTLYQNGVPAGGGGGSSQWTTVVSDIYFTAGNVGIGTTAPLSKLHVGAYPILIGNSTDTDHGRFISALDSTLTDGTAKYISIGKTNSGNNQAEFSYYHVSDGSAANYAGIGLYGGSYLHVTAAGNVGIGTTTPQSKLVVQGTTLLNGTVTTNNNNINAGSGTVTATTFSGTATQVSSTLTRGSYLTGNNFDGSVATTWAVDADSANTAGKVVVRDASGNFSASNVTLNQLTTSNLLILDASYTTKYQIAPIRNVVYIDSGPRSTFTLSTNGYFGGNASNVHIFVDNSKLSYYSETINDYQLALSYDNINDKTLYTITLTTAAVFGNVVDITIWPQVLQESLPNAQRFYQRVDVQSDFISSGTSLYYLAGNVGIGTTNPQSSLHVEGPITAGNTPFKVYTASGILSASGVELSVNLPTNTTVNSIFSLSGMTSNTANGDWIGFTTNNIYGGTYLDWNVGHYIHYTSNVIRLVPTATTAGKPFKLCIMSTS